MRLTTSQTFEIIQMANISSAEDFQKKLEKHEREENKACQQIENRRKILIAEENKRLSEEKELQETVRKQEEFEAAEIIRKQKEAQEELERAEQDRIRKELERAEQEELELR